MKQNRTRNPKVLWLSPNKFVFEFHGCSSKSEEPAELILAERSQPLKLFKSNSRIPDRLCWFCENGITLELLSYRSRLTCLLEKVGGDVYFCEDFKPGPSFGECVENDVGERRKKAEAIFARIRLESYCWDCRYWNTKDRFKIVEEDGIRYIYECPDAVFCELKKKPGYQGFCSGFRPSKLARESFKKQKHRINEYLEKLKTAEKHRVKLTKSARYPNCREHEQPHPTSLKKKKQNSQT